MKPEISFYGAVPLKCVGFWCVGGNPLVPTTKEPNWFHRVMHKIILGWEWEDAQ